MTVLMFQPRFAPLVADGTKRQTIRPPRKRLIHIGDRLSLRQWSEKPYRSPQILLREAMCIGVDLVVMDDLVALVNGAEFDRHRFAKADGFATWPELVSWFDNVHGLPFSGILIRWRL